MSDIDFDELDKAVTNLMGNVNDKDKEKTEPNTVEIDSTIDPDETPKFDKLNEATKKISGIDEPDDDKVEDEPEEKPAPAPVVSRPKPTSARFMDMVHPSADMRTAGGSQPSTTPAAPVTHKGVDINPLTDELDDDEPQTPFLPDANEKVNKRPLGAVSWPFSRNSEKSDSKDETQEKIDEPVDEFDSEVVETVAINNDEQVKQPEHKGLDEQPADPAHIDTEPTEQDRELQSIEAEPVAGADAVVQDIVNDESIEKVESGDTEHLREGHGDDEEDTKKDDKASEAHEATGDIYDVKDYHQPLGHPAKQKSGWGTVVIIISIIVICVAIGAAVFFVFGGGL